jgi:hypothetical protein
MSDAAADVAAVAEGFVVDEDGVGDDHSDEVVMVGTPCPSRGGASGRRRRCCLDVRSNLRNGAKAATLTVATTSENVSRKDAVQLIRTRVILSKGAEMLIVSS